MTAGADEAMSACGGRRSSQRDFFFGFLFLHAADINTLIQKSLFSRTFSCRRKNQFSCAGLLNGPHVKMGLIPAPSSPSQSVQFFHLLTLLFPLIFLFLPSPLYHFIFSPLLSTGGGWLGGAADKVAAGRGSEAARWLAMKWQGGDWPRGGG